MLKADTLRPQDVLCACKIFSHELGRTEWTYAGLAAAVGVSAGEAHNSYRRCRAALIITPGGCTDRRHLVELLAVAAPIVFYATRGGLAGGMPTATWAPSLRNKFDHPAGALPCVWSLQGASTGAVQGESVDPIYPTVPEAARQDLLVYELLALVDVVRVGGRSDRERATRLLEQRVVGKERS
jgi:hypothetical protein